MKPAPEVFEEKLRQLDAKCRGCLELFRLTPTISNLATGNYFAPTVIRFSIGRLLRHQGWDQPQRWWPEEPVGLTVHQKLEKIARQLYAGATQWEVTRKERVGHPLVKWLAEQVDWDLTWRTPNLLGGTLSHEEVLRRAEDGESLVAIGRSAGTSRERVRQILARYGFSAREHRRAIKQAREKEVQARRQAEQAARKATRHAANLRLAEQKYGQLKIWWDEGKPYAEMARLASCSTGNLTARITHLRKAFGWFPFRRSSESSGYTAKGKHRRHASPLSNNQLIAQFTPWHAWWQSGDSYAAIAAKAGVPVDQVRREVNRVRRRLNGWFLPHQIDQVDALRFASWQTWWATGDSMREIAEKANTSRLHVANAIHALRRRHPGWFPLRVVHRTSWKQRVAEVKLLVEAIPTLDPAKGFSLDSARADGVYKAREVVKTRTRKQKKVIVKYDATKEHPAQTDLIDEDVPVGKLQEQEWSGLITPAQKAELLNHVEILARGVRSARSRANDVEVDLNAKIGGAMLKYVFGENTARAAKHEGVAKK